MREAILWILLVSFIAVAGIGGWLVKRWWNYNVPYGYEEQVEETVRKMVKPEYLKDEYR